MRRELDADGAAVEMLETRVLLSGSALGISQVAVPGGTELRIEGTGGGDHINLVQTSEGLVVNNFKWSQTVAGPFRDVRIDGGGGNDSIVVDASVRVDCTLYAGTGKNLLQAGSGNDVLDCVGSTADTLIGGSGRDSFWLDASGKEKILNLRSDEITAGDVHRVGAFYTGATGSSKRHPAKSHVKPTAKAFLTEPTTTDGSTYQDFSDHPLFSSAGPSESDVQQGQIGDCFYVSVLSSVAKIDPWRIRQSILDMGDGTYLVQFSRGSGDVYVRVDAKLPVNAYGGLDYANFGAQGSLWVAIMEKAYAIFRGPGASYGSIDGGWMDEAYASLGASSQSFFSASGADAFLALIQQQLAAGKSVTYGSLAPADGASLIGDHAYTVDAVNLDSDGRPISLRLRNPWGFDGAGNDGNDDGYVTVTARQAYDSMIGIVSAQV